MVLPGLSLFLAALTLSMLSSGVPGMHCLLGERKEDREKSGPVSYFYVAMTPGGLGVYENRDITEAAEAVITDRHRWAQGG